MSLINDIENEVRDLENELKWLKTNISEGENCSEDEEVDWSSINSQVEDVECASNNLIEKVQELIEIIRDLD